MLTSTTFFLFYCISWCSSSRIFYWHGHPDFTFYYEVIKNKSAITNRWTHKNKLNGEIHSGDFNDSLVCALDKFFDLGAILHQSQIFLKRIEKCAINAYNTDLQKTINFLWENKSEEYEMKVNHYATRNSLGKLLIDDRKQKTMKNLKETIPRTLISWKKQHDGLSVKMKHELSNVSDALDLYFARYAALYAELDDVNHAEQFSIFELEASETMSILLQISRDYGQIENFFKELKTFSDDDISQYIKIYEKEKFKIFLFEIENSNPKKEKRRKKKSKNGFRPENQEEAVNQEELDSFKKALEKKYNYTIIDTAEHKDARNQYITDGLNKPRPDGLLGRVRKDFQAAFVSQNCSEIG